MSARHVPLELWHPGIDIHALMRIFNPFLTSLSPVCPPIQFPSLCFTHPASATSGAPPSCEWSSQGNVTKFSLVCYFPFYDAPELWGNTHVIAKLYIIIHNTEHDSPSEGQLFYSQKFIISGDGQQPWQAMIIHNIHYSIWPRTTHPFSHYIHRIQIKFNYSDNRYT